MATPPPRSGPITNIAQSSLVARGLPIFTIGMLIAIVGIHYYVSKLPHNSSEEIYTEYALFPARFTELGDYSLDALATFLTSAMLHANWPHVLANAYALFLFGLLSERFLGTGRVILVYLASAIGGDLLFIALNAEGWIPLVGASGAISGLFGSAIVAAPPSSRKALASNAVVWLGANVFLPALASQAGGRIAWEAHLGGFAVGLVMGWMLRAGLPRAVVTNAPVSTAPHTVGGTTKSATTGGSAASSAASRAGTAKPEPFNPVQRRR
jgi:membrane associated rhomboid family serine protease